VVRLIRVYSTAPVPAIAERAFADLGPIRVLDPDWSDLEQAEVLLVRAEELRAEDIDRATSLRLIARTGSGVDTVDVEAASRRGIPVLFVPAVGARPVAEGAIALILAATKRLGELAAVLRAGTWPSRYEIDVRDLGDTTLGVVGFGRIGREVASLAGPLGMEVIAYDPATTESLDGVELVDFDDLLGRADVISLHCPLNEQTRGLIDRGAIERMKPGAVLVNVARGEIVADERLLVEALDSGRLGALALDVFGEEPPEPSNPLLDDPRVICTPHSIGLTASWNRRVFGALAGDVARFFAGEAPVHVVDPAALDGAPQQS
jgi:D-3-phosphoglycerate dehydrogenase